MNKLKNIVKFIINDFASDDEFVPKNITFSMSKFNKIFVAKSTLKYR